MTGYGGTSILNGGDRPITIDDILLDEIEADNAEYECSLMVASASTNIIYRNKSNMKTFDLFLFLWYNRFNGFTPWRDKANVANLYNI